MKPWYEDTWADKALRFAIGAFIGAGSAWTLAMKWHIQEVLPFVGLLLACCSLIGSLCVVFGNQLIESFVLRGRKQ